MKRNLAIILLGTVTLTACSSKTDVNEKNFGMAIAQYLEKNGELCLRINKWPVDVTEMDLRMQKIRTTGGIAKQMEALASVGLVSGTDAEVEQTNMFGKNTTGQKYKVKRYVLTDQGKKYYRESEVERMTMDGKKKVMQGDICYGKKVLDKVVKWEGPMKFGDYQEAKVIYLYKIENLADWANNSEISSVFPYVGKNIKAAESIEQQGAVKLTSQGWEPRGLN